MPAPGPPWVYLEVAAAILSAAAWILIAAIWLRALPLTRAVRATGVLLLLSAAASTPFSKSSGPLPSICRLLTAVAFLLFVLALGRQFQLAAARRRTPPVEAPPTEPR